MGLLIVILQVVGLFAGSIATKRIKMIGFVIGGILLAVIVVCVVLGVVAASVAAFRGVKITISIDRQGLFDLLGELYTVQAA